ncbi:unnamed protein product [Durusdinium trenchii]|uniref:Transmembrane protein n=1 Tax=Durusdinium trenchii TaxID=1381693 RepID=A0ABP0NVH7_9DINO
MEGTEMSQRDVARSENEMSRESRPLEIQQWEEFDNYSREEKLEVLQKWINMDVPAIAVATVKGVVEQRPVLVSFWALGLLIAAFAGGLPVDPVSQEAPLGTSTELQPGSSTPVCLSLPLQYTTMLQQAEVIDSRELGQQAEVELEKAESAYYSKSGLFSCDDACQKAYDKVQMARAEVRRVQDHRDRVLSEGRHEVGIWSSYGVQDVRNSFWKAWQSGKDFASRLTFYNVLFSVGARDESLYIMIFRVIMQYVVNLTMGLIGAFGFFLYNMYYLILSYGASFFSGLAFFLLATVAGLSLLSTYLCSLYAVVAGGGAMIVQQAARHAALEMSKQAPLQELDAKPAKKAPPGATQRRCPV